MQGAIAKRSKPSASRRLFLQPILQCLLVVGICCLVRAQETPSALPPEDDDRLLDNENNDTSSESLFPTIVEEQTPSPSDSPTTPSTSPTFSPTAPTSSPSARPTISFPPTNPPTVTMPPSNSPSVSPKPSFSPRPTNQPSEAPTGEPSGRPTPNPTETPTISLEPTISEAPTISRSPTQSLEPSDFPSSFPSVSPTLFPTVSVEPSDSPSDEPSPAPTRSQEPSENPSISNQPSFSSSPSQMPSPAPTPGPPTSSPTIALSKSPTIPPTGMPTLTKIEVVQTNIYMYLEHLPGELNYTQAAQWRETTANHVWRYHNEMNKEIPGIHPVNVSRVHGTLIINQDFVPGSDGLGTLQIEYVQAIDYGLFDPEANIEVVERQMFVHPFRYNAQPYLIELITLWELDQWVALSGVYMGDTESPTSAPTTTLPPSGSLPNLSRRQLRAISACTVLGAILIVAALFWDRHRKEQMYLQTHARDFETLEYDNTGQPVDWRNPYSPTSIVNATSPQSQEDTPSASQDPVSAVARARSNSPQTTGSATVIAATPSGASGSRHSRTISLPPVGTGGRDSSRSSGIASHVLMTPPAMPLDHARHISVADTDITELTCSDGGGGGRSDNGSDGINGSGNIPVLPTIADEQYDQIPWSPMHIPTEDPYGSHDDGSNGDMEAARDIGIKYGGTMSGFGIQVQELE